jgi:hypothetical protein
MFAFNPPNIDTGANYTALAGQGLAAGISDAGSSISAAIEKLNAQKLSASQADSTAQLANKMGFIDNSTLEAIQQLPWQQKVSIAPNLIQLVGQKTMANHWNMMAAAKADASASKSQGIRPWDSTPAAGGLGSGGGLSDDNSQ